MKPIIQESPFLAFWWYFAMRCKDNARKQKEYVGEINCNAILYFWFVFDFAFVIIC